MDDVHLARRLAHELERSLLSLQLRLSSLARGTADYRKEAEACLVEVEALRSLAADFRMLGNLPLETRPFSLEPLIQTLARRFQPIADARGIVIETAPDPGLGRGASGSHRAGAREPPGQRSEVLARAEPCRGRRA